MHSIRPIAIITALCASASWAKPINGPPVCSPQTKLVGNGDPHQNYYYIQVSDNLQCGNQDSCSVSHLTSHTIGWTASGGIGSWISGGFAVSESYTTGNTYTCDGNPGQTVCVWDKIAHTAYTVHLTGMGANCAHEGPNEVVKSPNSNNDGGNYVCKYDGDCKSDGANYWDNNGPATGPP